MERYKYTECRDYTMNNRLCCGMTPEIQSQVELNNIQNRLIKDRNFRYNVQFNIAKALSAVDSRVTSCFTDIYISEVTDYLMQLLMNNSILPTVYRIYPEIKLEDDEEYEGDAVVWLTTTEDREIQFVQSKTEDYESGFYVLEGDYILHIGLPGFLEATIYVSANGDEEDIKVPVLLQRDIESI